VDGERDTAHGEDEKAAALVGSGGEDGFDGATIQPGGGGPVGIGAGSEDGDGRNAVAGVDGGLELSDVDDGVGVLEDGGPGEVGRRGVGSGLNPGFEFLFPGVEEFGRVLGDLGVDDGVVEGTEEDEVVDGVEFLGGESALTSRAAGTAGVDVGGLSDGGVESEAAAALRVGAAAGGLAPEERELTLADGRDGVGNRSKSSGSSVTGGGEPGADRGGVVRSQEWGQARHADF
jgi:hypothetical protein